MAQFVDIPLTPALNVAKAMVIYTGKTATSTQPGQMMCGGYLINSGATLEAICNSLPTGSANVNFQTAGVT